MNRIALLSVLVGIAGCASGGAEPAGEEAELRVLIEPAVKGWTIRANRPASLALFEVYPHIGVSLLFPDPSREDGHIDAGETRILINPGGLVRQHRTAYQLRASVSTRVVLAVACECTFNFDAVARPDGLSELFGASPPQNAQVAAIRLIEEILPSPDVTYALARH